MKVYLNSEGAIMQTVPSVIPRGSTVTDFEVEAPFSAAIMAVRFTLRTGTTEPMILPMVSSVSAPGLNLWSAKLDAAVTEFSGSVPYSIEVQDASGYLIRTVKGSLTISPGQTPTVPSAPPQDVWTAIRDYLNQILSYAKEAAIDSNEAKEWIEDFEVARGITVSESGKSVLYKLVESGTLSELVAMLEAYKNGEIKTDTSELEQDVSDLQRWVEIFESAKGLPVTEENGAIRIYKLIKSGDLNALLEMLGAYQRGEIGSGDATSPTAKVEQTTDGAKITITDKNGTTVANVSNGKDGADGKDGTDGQDGADGAPGKSAYAYAQDGGYTGTEAEFAKKLASSEGDNYVTAYGAKGDGVTDDTAAFKAALAAERVVFVPGGTYKLSEGIVIGDNSCLELSQDTVLNFTNTSGNCITLGMVSHLKGNHATVNVPYEFSGNVVYAYSADTLEAEQKAVPPFTQWDPMWKSGRYVTDLNICKADSRGLHYAVNPDECKGTAVYLSASGTSGALTYMWGIHYTNLRIAGAFSYGVRAVNINNAWMHEMRIDAFIDACEIGVSLEECANVYVSAIVQPRRAYSTDKVYKPYAKHGIQMIRSKNVDLSGSRVWDWNATNTLWTEGGEYQHISMIGDCSGAILNDYMYHDYGDTRKRIYTDNKSNLDQLTIMQEPIDRWFKLRNGAPYYNDGYIDRKLVTQETLDEHFTTDIVKNFTDVLAEAIDTDGSIFGDVGYKNGHLNGSGVFVESAYYTATGFIPLKVGQTLYVNDMTYATYDGYCCVCLYDSAQNFISYASAKNLVTGNYYYVAYTATANGFSISPNNISANKNVAFVRLSVYKRNVGGNPMASIDEPIKYTVEGFLADGVKVKGENVIGNVGEVKPDWIATHTYVEGASVYDERDLFFEDSNSAYLKDYGGSFKINIGIEYDVYWGGERYACEAKDYDGEPYLGNGSLVFGVADTGEPFCLYGSFMSADTIAYIKKDNSETETISLKVTTKGEAEYSKMPVEYLPDDIGTSIDGTAEVGQTIIVKEVDASGKPTKWEAAEHYYSGEKELLSNASFTVDPNNPNIQVAFASKIGLTEGKTYKAICNGVTYECVAEAHTVSMLGMTANCLVIGNPVVVGGTNNNMPFAYADAPALGGGGFMALAAGTYTLTVIGFDEVIQDIPQKYLANAFPYYIEATAEWDNNISNGPTNYSFSNNPSEVAEAFALGRTIILKVRLTTHLEHFTAFYTLVGGYIAPENGRFAGLFVLPVSTYGNSYMHAIAFIGGHEASLIVGDKGDGTLGLLEY